MLLTVLGGLGLLLNGLALLAANTRRATGPWLRGWVAHSTGSPAAAALTGLVAGALTQSAQSVTTVAAGLVQSGSMAVHRTLPLLAWANVGTCGIVLAASLDIGTVALLLVGAAGLLGYFRVDLHGRLAPLLGALVGLGLTLLGLDLLKTGLASLAGDAGLAAGYGVVLPLLGAALLSAVAQSSSPANLVTIGFVAGGVLSLEQGALAVALANAGAGLGMLGAVRGVSGSARRLGQFQALSRGAGSALLLALLALEWAGLPGPVALIGRLAGEEAALRVGVLMLLLQIGTALLGAALEPATLRLLAAWSPESPDETLARPRYVYPGAADEPATALDLAAREQVRLAERLPMLLDTARGEAGAGHPGRAALEAGSSALEATLRAFLAETLARAGAGTDRALLDRLVAARARTDDLAALRDATSGFAAVLEETGPDAASAPMLRRMAEALHLLLSELADAVRAADAAAADLLAALTADRSDTLERLRRGIARGDAALPPAEHEELLRAMALFERAAWLLRREAVALRQA